MTPTRTLAAVEHDPTDADLLGRFAAARDDAAFAAVVRRHQDDARAEGELLGGLRPTDPGFEFSPLVVGHGRGSESGHRAPPTETLLTRVSARKDVFNEFATQDSSFSPNLQLITRAVDATEPTFYEPEGRADNSMRIADSRIFTVGLVAPLIN